MDGLCHRFGFGIRGWHAPSAASQRPVAIAQFNFHAKRFARSFEILKEAVNIDSGTGENVLGFREDVLDEGGWHDPQRDLPVDAAEGQIVNLIAKWWNIGALG